ncbi:hypothetical protein [Gracilibacillus sp. YIM 98692]|uniref:hypothetical protein n=1 Tax=Gracilibacillus sp. YIM 98692 TaxID=2663532 RepID=UPI0013D7FD4B|nr:hypothetical protein [Gracilibacillus sp. YIM 98692]
MSKLGPFEFKNSSTGITAIRKERANMHNQGDFMDKYDRLYPDGKYVLHGEPPRIRIRDMHKYCKSVGKQPMELISNVALDDFAQ